jgi:WhiB family redox-sensing transcriptional regulator
VQQQCLDFAMRLRITHGVWGGLTERERRVLRRRRRKAHDATLN